MRRIALLTSFLLLFLLGGISNAQVNEICGRTGEMTSLGDSYGYVPYLYGKIVLEGVDPDSK